MADITVPPRIFDRLDALERQVAALQRSPQLQSSTIQGGRVAVVTRVGARVAAIGEDADDPNTIGSIFYATDGSVLISAGKVPALSGGEGVQLGPTADPSFLWNKADGTLRPSQVIPMAGQSARQILPTVTTFALCYDAWVQRAATRYAHMRFDVGVDAGVSGELRAVMRAADGTTVLATSTVQSMSSTPGELFTVTLSWAPAALQPNLSALFRIEARHTGGTGNLNVYPPYGIDLGDHRSTATSSGAWTVA